MWEKIGAYGDLVGKYEGKKTTWEDINVDGRIIFELILSKSVGRTWTGLIWLRVWKDSGLL
jgi:hypothetical protein